MKTRVYKYGERYFPQYKGWLFWKFIYNRHEYDLYGPSAEYFSTAEEAIEYLQKGSWQGYSKVVWESKS